MRGSRNSSTTARARSTSSSLSSSLSGTCSSNSTGSSIRKSRSPNRITRSSIHSNREESYDVCIVHTYEGLLPKECLTARYADIIYEWTFPKGSEIQYNVEHVFEDMDGRELRKMPIKMNEETLWVDCVPQVGTRPSI